MENNESYVFTLRVWREGDVWRWSLKKSGEFRRIGFPDLDSLYLYLSALIENGSHRNDIGFESEDESDGN